jgi:hypothetical protein
MTWTTLASATTAGRLRGAGERAPAVQPRAQRLAGHVRHHEVRQLVRHPGGEHGDDVRVLERRGEEDLAPEALAVDPRGELRGEHLHDDASAERRVLGDEHARHPPAPELAAEAVGAAEVHLKPVAQLRHWLAACGLRGWAGPAGGTRTLPASPLDGRGPAVATAAAPRGPSMLILPPESDSGKAVWVS